MLKKLDEKLVQKKKRGTTNRSKNMRRGCNSCFFHSCNKCSQEAQQSQPHHMVASLSQPHHTPLLLVHQCMHLKQVSHPFLHPMPHHTALRKQLQLHPTHHHLLRINDFHSTWTLCRHFHIYQYSLFIFNC